MQTEPCCKFTTYWSQGYTDWMHVNEKPLALQEITNKLTNQSFTVMSDAFGKNHKCGIYFVVDDDDKY